METISYLKENSGSEAWMNSTKCVAVGKIYTERIP
jgi:hypothetical protein